jgi:hypothetical protein
MKPFDIEAAKRGEPIQLGPGYGTLEWQDVHFVGLSNNGLPVVQSKYNRESCLVIGLLEKLRMKPQKRTVHINVYNKQGDTNTEGFKAYAFVNQSDAEVNMIDNTWGVLGTVTLEIEV